MAVDDLLIHDGVCTSVSLCTFEENSCGYLNDASADFDWKIGNGEYLNQTFTIDMIDVY